MATPSLKRKQADSITPPQDPRSIRRRFRSSSMSDLPKLDDTNLDTTDDQNISTSKPSNIDTNFDLTNVSKLISDTLSHDKFVDSLVTKLVPILTPVLSNALSPMISAAVNAAVESATKPLEQKIRDQGDQINAYEQTIGYLTTENAQMFKRIVQLEEDTEELEQYGRRNSLRFHNVALTEDVTTDAVVMNICKEKLDVAISDDDIFRSHPVGKPNKNGRRQIICRFRNWKIKNAIYSAKKKLKGDPSHILVTEDLTLYRQRIVSDLVLRKRSGQIHSFWTNDGRIFIKFTERGQKYLIRSNEDLEDLIDAPFMNDDAASED